MKPIAFVVVIIAIVTLACGTSSVREASAPDANRNASVKPQNTATPVPAISSFEPIEILKARQTAINNGDFEAYKKTVGDLKIYTDTKGDVEAYKKRYEEFLKSVDEKHFAGQRSVGRNFFPMPFKIRAQRIDGDTAEYEVRDVRGEYHCVGITNMNGEWKIDEFYGLQLCAN